VAEMAVSSQKERKDKWWRSWSRLRKIYHPLLLVSDNEYRKLYSAAKPHSEDLLGQARKTVEPYAGEAESFVGYESVVDELLEAIHYWVLDDKEFKRLCVVPPPKVFIVKGASGTGKTTLVHYLMYEANKRGFERGVPVFAETISPHKIYTKWFGESARHMASAFDRAFTRNTILFIDEAHSMVPQAAPSQGDSGAQESLNVQTTLLEKTNELEGGNYNCILLIATNEFGSVSDAFRRRGSTGTIDLDRELEKPMLLDLTRRLIAKYRLEGLNPQDVLSIIEQRVRALGHGSVTPADVANAFQITVAKKTRRSRSSYIQKIIGDVKPVAVTLDDFRDIKQLKEYDESDRKEVRRFVQKVNTGVSLSDVGGLHGIKESLVKDVEIALNYERAKIAGSTPIRGVLLFGPPGTGKTHLAQAIANETGASLYIIRAPQLMKPIYGQTEKLITDLFDEARKNAPSIIIIDEVDALMMKRDYGGPANVVTALLAEMSGTKPLENVVIFGTTNKINLIDEGFLRAGRFDRVVEIPPPRNDQEKKEVINVHLRKCNEFLGEDVNAGAVLELFGKYVVTPAQIERVISDAVELRIKELLALDKLIQNKGNQEQLSRVFGIYEDDLKRLYENLGLTFSYPALDLEKLNALNQTEYRLSLKHFKKAIELSRDGSLEEIKKMMSTIRGNRPEPAVGKVYGLAALTGAFQLPTDGIISIIESVCNPFGEKGRAEVIGSEVADSIKASAEHARIFLNEVCGWKLRNHEFYIDFITFAKGLDQKVISGPSAGLALGLAELSSAIHEPVLPNVVVTGGITPKGELIQVGGLDSKGMGKFVAALNTDGVDTIIIPESNYLNLSEEDKAFFRTHELNVVPAKDFWDGAKAAFESHPTKEVILQRIMESATISVRRDNSVLS
jgi:transitional endoplasmic reticulum ATPase